MTCGIVSDFKRFAVHDGDGIRTTVFLKGCPLRCVWCHNPEGISPKPELAFFGGKCVSCGDCVRICKNGAQIMTDRHIFDRSECAACGRCERECLVGALKFYGRRMTVGEVIAKVLEDKLFFDASGGGMTISGGEPTMQPEFTLELLKAAKEAGINTALDTCGFASCAVFGSMLPFTDTFLFDIKHSTDAGYKSCTGRGSELIFDNLRFLSDSGASIEIRVPLVPGFNSDYETLDGIGRLLSTVRTTKIRLLPYHDYAHSKYSALGLIDTLPAVKSPGKAELEAAASVLKKYSLNIIID